MRRPLASEEDGLVTAPPRSAQPFLIFNSVSRRNSRLLNVSLSTASPDWGFKAGSMTARAATRSWSLLQALRSTTVFCGSIASIKRRPRHVGFTPDSGHRSEAAAQRYGTPCGRRLAVTQ